MTKRDNRIATLPFNVELSCLIIALLATVTACSTSTQRISSMMQMYKPGGTTEQMHADFVGCGGSIVNGTPTGSEATLRSRAACMSAKGYLMAPAAKMSWIKAGESVEKAKKHIADCSRGSDPSIIVSRAQYRNCMREKGHGLAHEQWQKDFISCGGSLGGDYSTFQQGTLPALDSCMRRKGYVIIKL